MARSSASSRTDLVAEPGDPVPAGDDPVGDIVAALQDDPILLSTMMGNGATAEVDAALHAKLDAATVPVFVVLTRTPAGYGGDAADEELTSLVHAELERDGIYYVETSQGNGHVAVYGDIDSSVTNDDVLFSLARSAGMRQVYAAVEDSGSAVEVASVTEAGVVLDLAARTSIPVEEDGPVLSDDQVAGYTTRPWTSADFDIDDDRTEPMTPGLGALVGVTVALVLAAGAYRLLRAWSAARADRGLVLRDAREQLVAARTAASDAVEELDRLLGRVPGRRDAGRTDPEDRELASRCADTARDLLDSDALLDLVGAEVLATTGARALRPRAAAYRCCYVDPRHGEADHDSAIGGGLSVPVCRTCRRDLDAGRPPAALRDGRRPYYEGDSVWARTGYGATTDVLWVDVRQELAR